MRLKTPIAILVCVLICFLGVAQTTFAYYTNMPASVVIGQPDFTSNSVNQGGTVGPNTFNSVRFITFDTITNKLIISDPANHRVLIFNQIPTSNNASADVVIGQANFTTGTANQGGSVASNTMNAPSGIFFDPRSRKLLVADASNNRVLVFNQIPTSNNVSADVVIGQANFTTGTANQGGSVGPNTMSVPQGIFVDQNTGKLLIGDQSNSRVLIFNQIPTVNNASPDVVIGQVDFTHNAANQGTTVNANTLSFPLGITTDPNSGRLLVVDNANRRVLIYNRIPTSNNASADAVIGQVDFTHNSNNQGGSVGPNTVSAFQAIFLDPNTGKLYLSDQNNHRLLIFNQIPTTNNASADIVIGQPDFTHNSVNQGGSAAANTSSQASGVYVEPISNKLLFSQPANNRVAIYYNDSTPAGLTLSTPPQSVDNGLLKFLGNAATTVSNYTIKTVQYMINGGGLQGATPTDGSFDTANENFFFTFDPKANNNTNDGYFVQVQSRTSNYDLTDHLVYFQPFVLNAPADRSFISKALPTFSFSVVKQQTQLKENLSKYQLLLKKSGGDWKTYVDNIPVDYASIKDSVDNLQKSNLATDGNGTYEDKKILVVYSNNNSTMTVTPKAADDQGNANALSFDQNGKLLTNGGYEWKVQAIDKNGHVQETETRKFVVGASAFSNGSNWFPLQINSISGLGRVYLSTIAPQLIKPKYRIQTPNPTFKGIATANSTVQLDLTNETCLAKGESSCLQTFTANSNGASQFTLNTSSNALKTGNIYQAQFSVSQNGLFNALPPFQITR